MKLLAIAGALFVVILAVSSVSAQVWPYRVMIPAVMVDAPLNGLSPTDTPTVTATAMPTATPIYVVVTVILVPASDTPTPTVTPTITLTSTVTPTITPTPLPTAYGCTTPVTTRLVIYWDTEPNVGNRLLITYGYAASFGVTPTSSSSEGYAIDIVLSNGGLPRYHTITYTWLGYTDYTRPSRSQIGSANEALIEYGTIGIPYGPVQAVYQFCQG